jgi:bacteriocin biosynthesis cyclodehydratase domain-containing protein
METRLEPVAAGPGPVSVRVRTVPGVHVATVSDGRMVIKRGVTEMLVSGAAATEIVRPLLEVLDGSRDRDEILGTFSDELAPLAAQLIAALEARRLVRNAEENASADEAGPLARLYDQIGTDAGAALSRLSAAHVVVLGDNLVSRTVVADLVDMGVANVRAMAYPGLDTREGLPAVRSSGDAVGDLVVATSDLGCSDALLDVNRESVAAGRPFLPAWVVGSVGRIGPMVIPRETACLRCASVLGWHEDTSPLPDDATRANVPAPAAPQAVRGRWPSAHALVGHVTAAEAVKHLAGSPPSDVVGLAIRLDLRQFGGTVRRALKAPRCPDCSDVAQHGVPAVLAGPQIPMRWAGAHS